MPSGVNVYAKSASEAKAKVNHSLAGAKDRRAGFARKLKPGLYNVTIVRVIRA